MRRKLTDFVGVLVLIVIVVCSVGAVSDLLENKESDRRYASFFTEEQAVDVLLIGSSHIRHGVFPMELWRTRGIAAYNLAGNGCTIPSAYWVLVNALDYRVPEVVVMDVFDMWPGRIVSDRYGHVHDQFDAFPLSVHKAQMVLDLFRDPMLTDRNGNNLYEKRWEFFWNLGEYHSRWASLGEEDFAGERPVYDEQAKEYLEKIIDLCDDRGIQLILVNTGFDCKDEAKLFQDSFDVREESLLEEEKVKRLVENLGERVEAWKADEWDVADWGAEALDLEPSDTADLIIAVYSKHDGKVVDVRGF